MSFFAADSKRCDWFLNLWIFGGFQFTVSQILARMVEAVSTEQLATSANAPRDIRESNVKDAVSSFKLFSVCYSLPSEYGFVTVPPHWLFGRFLFAIICKT